MTTEISTLNSSWPAALPFELALGVRPTNDILTMYGLMPPDLDALYNNRTFRKELVAAQKEVAESGVSFQRKAAIQAEMYLENIDNMMIDPDVAPSTKLEAFKFLVKCGDLEPVHTTDNQTGATFNIQINI